MTFGIPPKFCEVFFLIVQAKHPFLIILVLNVLAAKCSCSFCTSLMERKLFGVVGVFCFFLSLCYGSKTYFCLQCITGLHNTNNAMSFFPQDLLMNCVTIVPNLYDFVITKSYYSYTKIAGFLPAIYVFKQLQTTGFSLCYKLE